MLHSRMTPADNNAGGAGSSIITRARVIDGTGAPEFTADIVVTRGVISAILQPGTALSTPGGREVTVIDAGGLVVAPGFIDVHSHADNAPLLAEEDLTKIAQGVTTEVTGNCGYSLAPVTAHHQEAFLADSRKLFPFEYGGWRGVADWFERVDARGTVVNVCPLIGHGTLRIAVIGAEDLPASESDLAAMGALLEEAIDAGAFGLSSGLIYPPGIYSTSEELALLASRMPPDRVYATHMRDESARLLDSIEEALAVGRTAGCRVQISHLKAAGKQNWGGVREALEKLDAARREGIPVTQDVYPYAAASTSLSICLPPWAHDGGVAATVRLLHSSEAVARMREQILAGDDGTWENVVFGAGYDGIMISDTGSHRFEGYTLDKLGNELGITPLDALFTVLREEELNARMVVFDMAEADLQAALESRHTTIGSDGLPPGRAGRQHPRLYGTFPRVLGHYVRERGVLSLTEAIRRMTSLPAEIFGVPDRGSIAVGKVADLVCFDPERVDHPGDYVQPELPPVGVEWVMLNGHVAHADGQWQGVRRGARLLPAGHSPRVAAATR